MEIYRGSHDLSRSHKVVDLADAVLSLQILAGMMHESSVNLAADVDRDNKIGMAEVIYVLQQIAGL